MSTESIPSSEVELSVKVSSGTDGPTIVLVHGFPDTQHVWDSVLPLLEPFFRVVTYDVRGAGESTAPQGCSGYRMGNLVSDLATVIEHVQPDGGAVHLVGHDWGSVQLWGAVMREANDVRLTGRIASFTSISGPGLDLFGHFFRSGLQHMRFASVLRQAAHSWYVVAFQAPFLPELVARRFGNRIRRSLARGIGTIDGHWGESFERDFIHGINLYRANGLSFQRSSTSVPVQIVVPIKDAFISPAVFADIAEFAPDVRRVDVVAGHWVVQSQPQVIADTVRVFIEEIEDRSTTRRRA